MARGEHLNTIEENGLKVNTNTDGRFVCRPNMVTDNFHMKQKHLFNVIMKKEQVEMRESYLEKLS